MEKQKYSKYLIGLIWILTIVGTFAHIINVPHMDTLAPFYLLILVGIVFIMQPRPTQWWFVGVGIVTFFIEVLGVHTGFPFGNYVYTGLGIHVFQTPIIIGLLWSIVILGALSLVQKNPLKKVWAVVLVLIFDIILEPAATNLGYWVWPDGVPINNYISWVVIASIALIPKLEVHKIASHAFLAQFLFLLVMII